MASEQSPEVPAVSRRRLIGYLAGLGAAGAVGAGAVALSGNDESPASTAAPAGPGYGPVEAFAGTHQAGIATPRPANLVLAAFDVSTASAGDLGRTLRDWTAGIRAMTQGKPSGAGDSGEAQGLPAAQLTVTVGVGPSLFDRRFGLAARRPAALEPIPALARDRIAEQVSNGDLVVQSCAEDATVAAHAVRELVRLGAGRVRLRWLVSGFAPSPALLGGTTPRNSLGFMDGSANPAPGSAAFDAAVWVRSQDAPEWLRGGTYLCYRKIRIDLPAWDALTVADQQIVIGRAKASGAPLSGGTERSALDLAAHDSFGVPLIPPDSHVRLAAAAVNSGAQILRRSFAYDNGVGDAGQLFLAFNADPPSQFVRILQRLAGSDRLNQFTTHLATGIWAMLPAPRSGGWLGQALFS